jgi:anti-anti-sigma factor
VSLTRPIGSTSGTARLRTSSGSGPLVAPADNRQFGIRESQGDRRTPLALAGKLDVATARALRDRPNQSRADSRDVPLDLSRLDFIVSTGIHVLAQAVSDARSDEVKLEVEGNLALQTRRGGCAPQRGTVVARARGRLSRAVQDPREHAPQIADLGGMSRSRTPHIKQVLPSILLIVIVGFAALAWGSASAKAMTAPVDLALGRPVVASSVQSSSYPASQAVDGSLSTRWSSAFSDPQWIYVDLGSTHNISKVVLDWETAYAKAYRIQVSNDAANWTTIYSTSTGTGGVNDLTGLHGSGRYVRMYGTTRGTHGASRAGMKRRPRQRRERRKRLTVRRRRKAGRSRGHARKWGYSLWEFSVYGTTSTSSSTQTSSSSSSPSHIYWGAYMNGSPTYTYYFGSLAPDGQAWQDAPWGGTGNTWDQFESDAGKKVSIEHYGQPPPWNQSFDSHAANLVLARGAIPAIDINTALGPNGTTLSDQQVANGLYDSQITSWFKAAAQWGHPFFLMPDVEMNGGWEPYAPGNNGNTAASFVAMWRHMHDLAVAAGATNVTWVWCPNVDPGNLFTPYSQLYPGDSYVDWTGMDGYNQNGTQSFSSVFGSSYNTLLSLAPTKPIMISQTGSVEGGIGKAAWITDMLSTQLPNNFTQIKALLWFNWRVYQNGAWYDWPIESSTSAMAAWQAGIGSSYYASNSYGNLPLLTKVRPLP